MCDDFCIFLWPIDHFCKLVFWKCFVVFPWGLSQKWSDDFIRTGFPLIMGYVCSVLFAYWFVCTISLYQFWSKSLPLNFLSLFYVVLYRLFWCGMMFNLTKPYLYNTVALKAIQEGFASTYLTTCFCVICSKLYK